MEEKALRELMSAESLSRIPFFREFREAELEDLKHAMEVERASQGEAIVRENQICSPDFYILVEGSVEIREGDVVVARRQPYAILGEISFVVERPRIASVIAATDCVLLHVDSVQVRALLQKNPMVAWKLMEAVARLIGERFIELDRRVWEMLRKLPKQLQEDYIQIREAALNHTPESR